MKDTFYVYVGTPRGGSYKIVRYAEDKEAARAEVEAEGKTVVKIRRPPHQGPKLPRRY